MHANETGTTALMQNRQRQMTAEESNYDRYARNINEQYIQLKEVAKLYCNDTAAVLFRIE